MTQQSSAGAQVPDPNADWARAIAEMTAHPEAEVADVADGSEEVIEPDGGPADSPPPDAVPEAAAAGGGGRARAAVVATLGAATIIVGSLGIWATVAAHDSRASAAAASSANAALVDQSATQGVERAVTSAVNTIFSYSYADTERTKAAAQELLTGPAIRQYNQLFALVEQQAPKEKLVVTTRVTDIGVELLNGGHARLLVFANQQDSSAGTSKATYGGAMFAVTAVNEHGRWQIENIDTFTG